MADNQAVLRALNGANNDAEDLEAGHNGGADSEASGDEEDGDDPNPRLLSPPYHPSVDNDLVLAASRNFDFDAARAEAEEFFKKVNNNAEFAPSQRELSTHIMKSYDLYRTHVLDTSRARDMAKVQLHVAKTAKVNPKEPANAVTDAIASHDVPTGHVRAGDISLAMASVTALAGSLGLTFAVFATCN